MCKLLIEISVNHFGVKKNEDFPEIILDSIPVPGFIANNSEKKIALKMLRQRVIQLQNCNISYFCIACNTAYVLLNDLQKVSKTPFLSMIEEVVKLVKEDKIKRIGLLASPPMIRYGLYQKALQEQGIETIIPSKKEQGYCEGIRSNILEEKESTGDRKKLLSVVDSLKSRGAQGIILGCTELPLIFPENYPLPVYNSVEILAMALLQKYYKNPRCRFTPTSEVGCIGCNRIRKAQR